MGIFDRLRPSTFDDPPPTEIRTYDPPPPPIEFQISSIEVAQLVGSLDAETLPAVYAAVDLIASSIARLDLLPASPLSRRPDPFTTRGEFFFSTAWSLAAGGDAYWLQTRTDRGVDSLEVLDPARMVVRWAEGSRRRRVYAYDGTDLDASRVSHLRFHPRPGRETGLSPIEAARTTWNGAAYSERWGSRLFADSGVPSGVLKVDYELSPEESLRLRDQWTAARNGSKSTAVLSGGVSFEGVELSPADLAWLEYRSATALDVARIFHIPADLLEVALEGSSLTYQNLAEVGADFVRWCLDAYLTLIAEAWSLLPGEAAARTFDTRPLYKASAEARARTLASLVASGVDPSAAAFETEFAVPITRPAEEVVL